ncbi:IclR family transcriptional regulator C-terminal domain-containing protein [Arthrobacter sp. ISL-28]|uniref:IclR family transcriptional regulator domain-containing protein n=1 Tax=Arthrobacter sp. ISL-28 TaxID=2819108 RepID=UPI001BEA8E15|nr:IclR family transcriptional regulator C-terminal domain-containing protein [Arthrobacter sp. ISL-28]MBT2522206.1 helix-turn-helix domain-containing protein [Arthrobacter sp. ISL-28]
MEEQPAYFVKSVEKAFDVLLAFTTEHPQLTVSQIAARTDMTRASARRFLMTLADLGYLRAEGSTYELTARSLDVGRSFLAGLTLPRVAEPHLKALAESLNETTALCILEGPDVVYVACVPSPRLLSVSITVGTRFPAWATSMGRVLLAGLPEPELQKYLQEVQLQRFTGRKISSPEQLRSEVESALSRGWSMVSEELEDGLRGVAVPVWRGNEMVAAANVSLQTHRASAEAIEETVVPRLQETARAIALDFGGPHAAAPSPKLNA